jgi:DNA adenine methylase
MLSYIGGKSKIGKWIVPFYPRDIETYVETFGGMFWCYFNMDLSSFQNLKKIVYNDFNLLNYNLFKCIQNPKTLQNALDGIQVQQLGVSLTPVGLKEKFYEYQKEIFDENLELVGVDYEVAAKYVYVVTQVFSGSKPEKSSFIDLKGKYRSKYLAFRDKLSNPKWVDHFMKITDVENLDFQQCIEKFDSTSTYFYVDPPYYKTENYYSNHDFGMNDHERLGKTLKSIQGKFSLSYYDFSLLHEWYPKEQFRWEEKEFAKAAAAKKGVKQNLGKELLILNY